MSVIYMFFFEPQLSGGGPPPPVTVQTYMPTFHPRRR